MPSAGRPFTQAMLDRLTHKGVRIAPLVLHAGVSSLEACEHPYPERYSVPAETARAVNTARAQGGRIVAVGTTAVRALESVVGDDAQVRAGRGWTDLVITPERGLRVVDAILTGLHVPKASHLSMLEAMAGREHLVRAYEAALERRYLWHEFGDLHLMLP
jgi:S-adenosylmethionine:tRNA ribosyltransferase-isomerase